VLLVALALATPALASCSSAADVAKGSSNIQDAVAHIPADATYAAITDWATIRQQNPEIGSGSDEGLGQLMNVPAPSNLVQYQQVMEDDYGWNVVADADWDLTYANYSDDGGPVVNLVKVGDSVDLDDFQAKLEDKGFTKQEVDGGTLWTISLDDVDPSADLPITAWFVDEDQRIVRDSIAPPDGSVTIDGDPSDDMQAIADQVGDATVARLNVGSSACTPVDPVTGSDPSRIEDQLAERADLERPTARAETWTGKPGSNPGEQGDTRAKTILLFDSDDAAQADHDARIKVYQEGTSLVTQQPYTELITLEDDSVSGNTATFTFSGATSRIYQQETQRDWPFAFCPPS
jgi:hypothetical protein